MDEFVNKEIEITDRLVNLIGGEIVSIEFNIKDKSKLDYLLCSNFEDKQKITKKKVKRFKKEIDNCREEIAGYLIELADIFENGHYYLEQGNVTKYFISDYYDDLVQILVKENIDISEILDLEDLTTSYGFNYEFIQDYINGVCNMYFYQYYKLSLDKTDKKVAEDEFEKVKKSRKIFSSDKVDITYLDDLFSKNKDILPQSIINAYNSIGDIKSLFITQIEGKTIKNVYLDDVEPFTNIEGDILIDYYCIESNYLNLLSKIEDSTFVFFDNLPIDLYLYEYAKAFILAYSEFETILNQNQTLISDTQEQKALKIFSYVLNSKYKNGYFGGEYENIEELKNKKGMYVSNEDMYDWGYKGGQYYKAWEIILNNPLIFEPLFSKFIVSKTIDEIEVTEDTSPNNHLKSTIEDYLEEFKEEINNNGYEILVKALFEYFTNGIFPILATKINFKKINKKRVGFALKTLYQSEKTESISFDYLLFAKTNINLFANEMVEEHNFRKSNLYKAFTTNPAR